MNWSENSKFWKPYYWNKTDLYIHQIKLYRNDFTSYYGFQKFELLEEFNLNWSVLASYALSATKLNVRSRFQPQILYCQSFIHFWPLEVQNFRAHKIEPLLTRIRFSQSYWRLREFFGRKSTFFSSYISKDSPFSCDHFDVKVVVKGWPEAEKNRKNTPKISINYHTFVTTSMTSSLWVIPELKVLYLKLWPSDFCDDPTTWWRSRAIWNIFVSWL